MAEVHYLTTQEFKEKVFDYTQSQEWNYQGEMPCIIDFYTTWCGPCKRLAPIMDELSETYKGQILFYKADIEREPELAQLFGINSIPQVLYVTTDGRLDLEKGLYPKESIIEIIEQFVLKK